MNKRKTGLLSTFFGRFVDGKANLLSIFKKVMFASYCRDETDPIALSGVSDFVIRLSNWRNSEMEIGTSWKDGLL